MDPEGEKSGRKESLWGALAFTLLVPLGLVFLPRVGLPGVPETFDDSGLVTRASLHIFALGVTPLISASIVVELVSLILPSWSRLRNGGPKKRAKLGRAAFILGAILAASQGYGMARLLQGTFERTEGGYFILLIVATLVAGSMLLAVIADLATRRGLVSAYVALAIAGQVSFERLQHRSVDAPRVLATLACAAALAFATWFVLRKAGPSSRERDGGVASYRVKPDDQNAITVDVPAPASGILPVLVASSAVASLRAVAPNFIIGEVGWFVLSLALQVVLAVLLGVAFYGPRRIADLWRRTGTRVARADLEGEARRRLAEAIVISIVYATFVVAVQKLAARLGVNGMLPIAIVPLTAVVLDLVEMFRARRQIPDLVVVWPEQRPYAIAVARHALDAEGIPLVVANAEFRRILPFAPFAPLDLMVPVPSAKRAREILERTLGAEASAEETEKAIEPLVKSAGLGGGRIATMILASVAFGGAAIALSGPPQLPANARGPVGRDVIQLVAVDDQGDDPLAEFRIDDKPIPCFNLETENAPIGKTQTKVRHYAVCKQANGETLAAARQHLEVWLATLPAPPGDRFATGPEPHYDDVADQFDEEGSRSWLLKGSPIIDGNDVANAMAMLQDPPDNFGSKQAVVTVELTKAGADKLERFTAANIGRRMAIVVEGRVSSAPRIISRIAGGRMQITMGAAGSPEQQLIQAKETEDALMGRVHR